MRAGYHSIHVNDKVYNYLHKKKIRPGFSYTEIIDWLIRFRVKHQHCKEIE